MAARSRSRSRRASPLKLPAAAQGYYMATREPLVCFVFLLPLIAAYEIGALLLRPMANPERELFAQSAILNVLAWFGAAGTWVPGVALLLTLLLWHWTSGKNWQIRGWTPLVMFAESIVVVPPLLVLARLLLPTGGARASDSLLKVQAVYTLGAAIYEELLFRFLLISVLLLILVDVFRAKRLPAAIIAGSLAAIAFAVCHLPPGGPAELSKDSVLLRRFVFHTLSGGYLALLFLTRGLGISTGSHAAYNLIALLWR
jgi:hypothetical protein